MVVHAGIDFDTGQFLTYNNVTKKFIYGKNAEKIKEIDDTFKRAEAIFHDITLFDSNTDNFGCVCVCLDPIYTNDLRQKIVQCSYDAGFQRIQIIDPNTAGYLSLIFKSFYKPKEGDIIWIFDEKKCQVWKIFGGFGSYVSMTEYKTGNVNFEETQSILKESNLRQLPNIVLYKSKLSFRSQFFISSFFKEMKLYEYGADGNKTNGALLKARIMSKTGKSKLLKFDIYNRLSKSISINVDGAPFWLFQKDEQLPIAKFFSVNANFLEVIEDANIETYILPSNVELQIAITIDDNCFYSLECYDKSIKISNYESITCAKLEIQYVSPQLNKSYVIPADFTFANENDAIVGIDFGTSKCCAAISAKDGIKIVDLDNRKILPSFVSFNGEKEENCGQVVVDKLQIDAASTVFDIKRWLGDGNGVAVDGMNCPFEVVYPKVFIPKKTDDTVWNFEEVQSKQRFLKIQTPEGQVMKYPEDCASILFKYIKEKAEKVHGKKLTEVVIPIPSTFNKAQIQSVLISACCAGWESIHILPDPVAAVFAYYLNRSRPKVSIIFVVNLGAGILDISILKVSKNAIEILGSICDFNLGGREFDQRIFNYFMETIGMIKEKTELHFMQICKKVKENLSTSDSQSINVVNADLLFFGKSEISRAKFESITLDLIAGIKDKVKSLLTSTSLEPNQIDKVLLFGGGCRMPMIQKLFEEIFPDSEQCRELIVDEILAISAAAYASALNMPPKKQCSLM